MEHKILHHLLLTAEVGEPQRAKRVLEVLFSRYRTFLSYVKIVRHYNRCRLMLCADTVRPAAGKTCFQNTECSLSVAKIVQTSGMKACFQIPECSLSYAKIVQGESRNKAGKRSFTRLGTAELMPVLCKDSANERNESLLSDSRVQPILLQRYCKKSDSS